MKLLVICILHHLNSVSKHGQIQLSKHLKHGQIHISPKFSCFREVYNFCGLLIHFFNQELSILHPFNSIDGGTGGAAAAQGATPYSTILEYSWCKSTSLIFRFRSISHNQSIFQEVPAANAVADISSRCSRQQQQQVRADSIGRAAAAAVGGGRRQRQVADGWQRQQQVPPPGKTRVALPAEVRERGAAAGIAAGTRNLRRRGGRRGGGARRGGRLGGAAAVGVGLLGGWIGRRKKEEEAEGGLICNSLKRRRGFFAKLELN
ncbi:uncharacterized protein LOC125519015 [Triticum urartu]|uniref:uncharacterized protein LOC125519015 n=1 Tax=Triticum urartu TaxID=4572 RepID=UPI002044BB07|nr:uncharacterized protein LOC125519015 [Triticum urartu]